jgi:proteasome lid subunit RPN8/RPN11
LTFRPGRPGISLPVMASEWFRCKWLFFPLFLREFFSAASEILREFPKKSRRTCEEIAEQYRSHPEGIPKPPELTICLFREKSL